MSKFTDHLWRDLVQEHGPALAYAGRPRPEPARVRRPRPRVLAGSMLGLAGAGAALVLGLTATASTPAFAVTRHDDGSVSVKINQRSGIAGANRELAAMGIRERVMAVGDSQPVPLNCLAPGPGRDGKSLVIKGFPKVSTGPVSALSGTSGGTGLGQHRLKYHAPGWPGRWHHLARGRLLLPVVRVTPARATRAPADPVTAAGARPGASVITRLQRAGGVRRAVAVLGRAPAPGCRRRAGCPTRCWRGRPNRGALRAGDAQVGAVRDAGHGRGGPRRRHRDPGGHAAGGDP